LEIFDDELRIQEASAPVVNVIEWLNIELIFFIHSKLILFFDYKCHVTEAKGEILRQDDPIVVVCIKSYTFAHIDHL
jgi:hypothetical protein